MGLGSAADIGHHLSTAQRAAEVVGALGKFGFGEIIRAGGLEKYLRNKAEDGEHVKRPLPERVRMLLEELGPTFVKTGQILSTRADLVGPEWIEELKRLRADVKPVEWELVKEILEAEHPGDLWETFETIEEEPLASASLGQVYRAVLKESGEQVVIKVLRPGARERMGSDLDLMRLLARLTRGYFAESGIDAESVVEEFAKQLERETDLTVEGRNTERMRADFADIDGVTFPQVFMEYTTRSVLVMEEVKGRLLTNISKDDLTKEQREQIAQNAADAVFKQCLEIGFFHADPHPGNIFVLEDEELCFIDCGMTGVIDPGTMEDLAKIVHGAVDGRLDDVVRVAVRISDAQPALEDDRTFRSDVWRFVDRFHAGGQGAGLQSIQMGGLLNEFFEILRKHHVQCPSDIVYLVKSLTTIEGAAEEIAPGFDVVSYVRPYVEKLIKRRYGLAALKERFEGAAASYGDLIESVPHEVDGLLRQIRKNQVSLNLEHKGLERLTSEIETASLNISWAVMVASIIVGSSVLLLADNVDRDPSYLSWIAVAAFVIGLGMGVARLVWARWIGR